MKAFFKAKKKMLVLVTIFFLIIGLACLYEFVLNPTNEVGIVVGLHTIKKNIHL